VFVKFNFLGILFVYSAMELEFFSMLLLQLFSVNDSITVSIFDFLFWNGKEKRHSKLFKIKRCYFSWSSGIPAKTEHN